MITNIKIRERETDRRSASELVYIHPNHPVVPALPDLSTRTNEGAKIKAKSAMKHQYTWPGPEIPGTNLFSRNC